MKPCIYLIPSVLAETAVHTIPFYITEVIKNCTVIFAENERTARRFLKSIYKEIVIDDFEWFPMHKAEQEQVRLLQLKIKEGKNIAIISEAGCPGVADPGQILVAAAQELNVTIQPLVGPNSILLALMASGMNGQQFEFTGYLPIETEKRIRAITMLENSSRKNNSTKIFIETPYRNNQLIEIMLKTCNPSTRLCIAAELTSKNEYIKTKKIADWKKEEISLHKKPAIFLLHAGTNQ